MKRDVYRNTFLWAFWGCGFFVMFFLGHCVHAEIYQYVDENGVIHITNVPTTPGLKGTVYSNRMKCPLSSMKPSPDSTRVSTIRTYTARESDYERMLDKYITQVSAHFGLDPKLVKAVIWAESGFNPYAISPKGAVGLMQLMPETAAEMGIFNPHHPFHNLVGGARYLKHMLTEFDSNLALALAAYNAGPNAVKQYGGIPPFEETRNYVRRVLKYYLYYSNKNGN